MKKRAPGEDRTHDLQIALAFVIMRLTRCLLRYRGRLVPPEIIDIEVIQDLPLVAIIYLKSV